MDTQLLETYVVTAKHGSVSSAARALGYTQSAVSRQILALEHEIGTRLFDRHSRGVEPTEAGRVLLDHAHVVLARLELARHDVDAVSRLAGGRLRVGAFTTASAVLLPRAMAAFAARRPQVSLSLVEGITRRLLDHLDANDADLAVVSAFPGQPLDRDRFTLVRLVEDAMLIALPPKHPLVRQRRRIRLAQLESEAWIGADTAADDRVLGPARLVAAVGAEFPVHEWTAKLGLVAAGLGVTLVPSLAARMGGDDVVLRALDPTEVPPRTVYAAMAGRRTPAPAAREFIATLRTTARSITKTTG